MKTTQEFIEIIDGIEDKEFKIIALKEYLCDFIDNMAGNWSPIRVKHDTGWYHSTYDSHPIDNISIGRETFEELKKYIK